MASVDRHAARLDFVPASDVKSWHRLPRSRARAGGQFLDAGILHRVFIVLPFYVFWGRLAVLIVFAYVAIWSAEACTRSAAAVDHDRAIAQRLALPAADATSLDWSQRTVVDADMAALADRSQLKQLELGPGQLSTAGFAALARCTSIEHLVLAEIIIDDAGLAALAKLPRLKILNIPATNLSDAGLAALAGAPSLELLRIGGTRITSQGIASLAKCPKLRQLILLTPQVDDAAVDPLASIDTLESLYLIESSLSERALYDLQSRRPLLHIH